MFLDVIFWNNSIRQYLLFLLFIFLGFVATEFVVIISRKLVNFAKNTKTKIDDILTAILEKPYPIKIVVVTLFVQIAFSFLTISKGFINIINDIAFFVYVFGISLFLIEFFKGVIKEYLEVKFKKTESKYDDQILPLIRALIKFTIWVTAIIIVLSKFNINVSALIGGLGIGGLAIAFAAQDFLGNFISGIVIFFEKPFQVDDVIQTSEGLGTIQEVGIRSTRVKTFDGTVIVIPNNKLSTNAIENISKRKMRKEKFTIGVVYDTSVAKMKLAKKIISDILKKNKNVYKDFHVIFGSFGDFSLNIKIIYYITELDYSKYLKIKDKINMDIKSEFEKASIDMAFPTQTIELKK